MMGYRHLRVWKLHWENWRLGLSLPVASDEERIEMVVSRLGVWLMKMERRKMVMPRHRRRLKCVVG